MSLPITGSTYRTPQDLSVTPLQPRRAIFIGSCFAEAWAAEVKKMPVSCEADSYLIGIELPELPEKPVADYDFQLVMFRLRSLLQDSTFTRLRHDDLQGHQDLLDRAIMMMKHDLKLAMRWNIEHGLLTFVFPLMLPQQNFVGRLMARYSLNNPVYFMEQLNKAVAEEVATYANAYFYDFNETLSTYGRRFAQEDVIASFAHGAFMYDWDYAFDFNTRLEPVEPATALYKPELFDVMAAGWNEILAMHSTIRQHESIKMVVLDLDDTLWRGVIAEMEGDDYPERGGWPFGLWEALLLLKRRGIMLGIISKNEEARVKEVWAPITKNLIQMADFAAIRINWLPKAENMASILADVNILPNSVLYIDDNPVERTAIKEAFPDIRVLGGNPVTWRRILMWSPETQVAAITSESAARTEMVQAQVRREDQRRQMSHEEFLATLQVRINLFKVGHIDPKFPRMLELLNKTNQFNSTGKRWTQEECIAAMSNGTRFYAFELKDKYTDYGLVGVFIVEDSTIIQFVMSCRIMGLEAEIAAISWITSLLRDEGVNDISARMIATDRNQPCRNLYARCRFTEENGEWKYTQPTAIPFPAHIPAISPKPIIGLV